MISKEMGCTDHSHGEEGADAWVFRHISPKRRMQSAFNGRGDVPCFLVYPIFSTSSSLGTYSLRESLDLASERKKFGKETIVVEGSVDGSQGECKGLDGGSSFPTTRNVFEELFAVFNGNLGGGGATVAGDGYSSGGTSTAARELANANTKQSGDDASVDRGEGKGQGDCEMVLPKPDGSTRETCIAAHHQPRASGDGQGNYTSNRGS